MSARIAVYVQPRASRTQIAGRHGDAIRIRLAAPPVDNAANLALIEFIAERCGVGKRSVRIVAGASSRHKVLEVDGLTADEIATRLSARDTR